MQTAILSCQCCKVRFQEEDESEDMEEDTSEVSEETVSDENEAIENETAPEEV